MTLKTRVVRRTNLIKLPLGSTDRSALHIYNCIRSSSDCVLKRLKHTIQLKKRREKENKLYRSLGSVHFYNFSLATNCNALGVLSTRSIKWYSMFYYYFCWVFVLNDVNERRCSLIDVYFIFETQRGHKIKWARAHSYFDELRATKSFGRKTHTSDERHRRHARFSRL